MSKSCREGLLWNDSGFNLEPRWQTEPSIEAIKPVCRRKLGIRAPDDCAVSFLAAGAFNRLYLVKSESLGPKKELVMRVSLPVDPHSKTAGEVATLGWIRRHTDVPVPEVVAFDDSSDNEIGFEWILMRLMPGTAVYYRWRSMSMEAKKALVEQVAEYQAQLFSSSRGFRGIGTLRSLVPEAGPEVIPSRLVSLFFFWGRHFDYDIPRGPFRSSHDWLDSYVKIIVQEQTTEADEAEDDEDREDAEYNLRVAKRLADLLPKIFPSVQNPAEPTVLWHHDLSLSNIMVDDRGSVTALIDWECVSTMPHWAATTTPQFLMGNQREEEPARGDYADESPEDAKAFGQHEDGLDNQGKNELYWIHLMEYEQTQLKKVYTDRMRQLWPSWDDDVANGELRADFLGALARCADGFHLKGIERWIDAIERGEFPGLADSLQAAP